MRYLESVYLTVSTYSKNHKKTDWQINNRETVNDYSRIVAIEKGEISDITVGHSYVYRLINGLLNG